MGVFAASLYWIIVAVWLGVLGCAIHYGVSTRSQFGAARVLLAVLAIDAVRDIAENVYFGLYFNSHYGFIDGAIARALAQPALLVLPKLLNVVAGFLVLFILFLQWMPRAMRERETLGTRATVDALTGLFNRGHFLALAQAEIQRCRRYGHACSALMIDIDQFKSINDRYGHAAGDRVIQAVAKLVRDVSRRSDVTARLGGEEFAIVLPETAQDQAVIFAARLRELAARTPVPTDKGPVNVTVSIGVAADDRGSSLDEVLGQADHALYEAKRGGRDQVRMFERPAPGASAASQPQGTVIASAHALR